MKDFRGNETRGFRMFCSNCGTQGSEGAAFCSKCGTALVANAGTPAEVQQPIVIDGKTYRPGSGEFAGLYSAGYGWVQSVDGKPVKVKPTSSTAAPRSTGRTIGGIVAFIAAALAGWQGFNWYSGFSQLQASGNPFAGILILLALGALAVGAGFGITGIVLLTKK